jgi:hypothetical protein
MEIETRTPRGDYRILQDSVDGCVESMEDQDLWKSGTKTNKEKENIKRIEKCEKGKN